MKKLDRFLVAQERDYPVALAEIRSGHKQSHWMWYIFPQIAGLGRSSTAQLYAIENADEAKAYMDNETLRAHLIRISEALLALESSDAEDIMGWPDCLKLQSCMTLFGVTNPEVAVFQQVLDKFYQGKSDERTLEIIGRVY